MRRTVNYNENVFLIKQILRISETFLGVRSSFD